VIETSSVYMVYKITPDFLQQFFELKLWKTLWRYCLSSDCWVDWNVWGFICWLRSENASV